MNKWKEVRFSAFLNLEKKPFGYVWREKSLKLIIAQKYAFLLFLCAKLSFSKEKLKCVTKCLTIKNSLSCAVDKSKNRQKCSKFRLLQLFQTSVEMSNALDTWLILTRGCRLNSIEAFSHYALIIEIKPLKIPDASVFVFPLSKVCSVKIQSFWTWGIQKNLGWVSFEIKSDNAIF